MRGYHPTMLDVAQQLLLKWERLNLDDEIDGVHDMTSLTFETIGLRGFDYRFNSFYHETNHPFGEALDRGPGCNVGGRVSWWGLVLLS